jgi:sigma-54 dependent transcriptional regulator, acetoin dehydrogenase operon transcriptional activator AcoR
MPSPWTARFSFEDILGESESLQSAIRVARQAARSDYPTLLVGESGTGKELLAHAIHSASLHREGPFVAVNCGTLSGDVAVAEMCGYEAGAFTGADRRMHVGIFDVARGGTLFLDELQDLPPTPQSVLLRFLESGTFRRVGGTRPVQSQPRMLAAANVGLHDLEARCRVRLDLLYRLNCLTIELQPLRNRREDIRPIAERCLREELHFLGHVDEGFWAGLRDSPYSWPGNARSVRNVLLKAILASREDRLTREDLPADLRMNVRGDGASRHRGGEDRDPSRDSLQAMLGATGHNVSEAARRLGIHRSTLYRRLSRSQKQSFPTG